MPVRVFDNAHSIAHVCVVHAQQRTTVAVDTKRTQWRLSMLGAQLGERANHVGATVLGQRAGDDLQGVSHCAVRPLQGPLQGSRSLCQTTRHGHLHRPTTCSHALSATNNATTRVVHDAAAG